MRAGIRMLAMVAGLVCAQAWADATSLEGTWKGPWYIGMTSGIATMEIAADGSGRIALTNLEDFGSQPVALEKVAFDGKVLAFVATGANGTPLSARLNLGADGAQLKGSGKHGSFGARLELRREN